MDIDFVGEKENFVVIYLDDIVVFCKSNDEHLKHIKQTFLKCRQFGLSLNPKKYHFDITKGKLLGHIVSIEGITIYTEQVKAILNINIP